MTKGTRNTTRRYSTWFQFFSLMSVAIIAKSDKCPSICQCDPSLLKAECSGIGLTIVPTNLPNTLQHLDLSNNSLTSQWNFKLNLPNLLTLNLSYNLLSQWRFLQNFSSPRLLSIDLQHNLLESIPENGLQRFGQLQVIRIHHNKLNYIALSTLSDLNNIHQVDLSYNAIEVISLPDAYGNLSHIETLDLSMNNLSELSIKEWSLLTDVKVLNLSGNQLTHIPSASCHNVTTAQNTLHNYTSVNDTPVAMNEWQTPLYDSENSEQIKGLRFLDLSNNRLNIMHSHAFMFLKNLEDLRLNNNYFVDLNPIWFANLFSLESLNLNVNPLIDIPQNAFFNCSALRYLTLSYMKKLTHIHFDAFNGLDNLVELTISNNILLTYLHAKTLSNVPSLRVLDINSDAISTIFPDLVANVSNLETIYMSGNPLKCGCDAQWIYEWITTYNNTMPNFQKPESIKCAIPYAVGDRSISDLGNYNFSCSSAKIVNFTSYEEAMFEVGSPAVLDCVSTGDPSPRTTWITPRGHMVLHHPAYINWLRPGPHHHTFHANHPWHDSDSYDHSVPQKDRIYVLNNGSLYVDYMLRNDAGAYTCMVENPHGNETIILHVRLDYSMLIWNVRISIVVGYACALGFFCIAVLTAVLRYIAYFCSAEQRQKRKSIRDVLASLDQYRIEKIDRLSAYKSEKIDRLSAYKTEKFDRLSAYKTEKFDKLSAYKSAKFDQLAQFKMAKVDKLRSYKNLTFTTLVHYIKGMREYYIAQMVRIKENCTQQAEKLCENYSTRSCAFKDFRSHKFDAFRENYASQIMKIREYGSSQVAKLREQYRSQQNHVLKLIELMDIGNCMTIVEAECMRTESMLFDPAEIDFDFDTHPVHVPYMFEDTESVYETAGSNVDINVSGKTKTSQEQIENINNHFEELYAHASPKDTTVYETRSKHRKQRRHRHKRPTNLPALEDTNDYRKQTRKKRRKRKDNKSKSRSYDDDTTAPDTPPEFRRTDAVLATVHNNYTGHSSDYETASAQPSRERSPDTPIAETQQDVLTVGEIQVTDSNQDQTSETNATASGDCVPLSPQHTPSTPTEEDCVIIIDPTKEEPTTNVSEVTSESTV